ncbi:hypothetical protein BFJ63_vAg1847 [Fusarium oxysporum f. sp. narcissi]|uniref:Uncharacterized protein n=1 Tax=Fusarium oxysporum f. sp. narcissi TaxID=451672 RepID=A0A4Q2W6S5_FUSOX|nr:hypothetical protein BFJ66_g6791 [Fusarium oxysporum f. sp. cepae]RYC95566.1 hypothetical protein BFJ63_vAg1847 [Fusarium oxysporum f. sp. narcissi]
MSQCFFHMTSVQIGPVHNKGTDSTTRTHTMNEVQNATQDYDLRNLLMPAMWVPSPRFMLLDSGSALRQRSADIQIAVRVEDGQFEELMNHDNS